MVEGKKRGRWLDLEMQDDVCVSVASYVPSDSFHLPLPLHAGQTDAGGYVISHTVNLVELPVTVRDRKGRFVFRPGTTELSSYENGQCRKSHYFEARTSQWRRVGVDHSGSMAPNGTK